MSSQHEPESEDGIALTQTRDIEKKVRERYEDDIAAAGIPRRWLLKKRMRDEIRSLIEQSIERSRAEPPRIHLY
jgi:hypothetical protein